MFQGVRKEIEIFRLVRVIIRGEMRRLLENLDRVVHVSVVTKTLKPTNEEGTEATEMSRPVRVIFWSEMNGQLYQGDCFIKVSKFT